MREDPGDTRAGMSTDRKGLRLRPMAGLRSLLDLWQHFKVNCLCRFIDALRSQL